ncbi:glutathione-dependent formaldehyde-activating enzyme [Devosia equisanguinis]|uniref:Glutathione-dependent formaldehyde-activating enzyme n=2 Tax=Devosia equisanguinis TaxID=2490941 RepID=A0A447IGD1_9HYPH|nr:glutathione-dependent formaldehyde-activating enzyme [Devosia equisanguinis]
MRGGGGHASLAIMSSMPHLDLTASCDCGAITLSVSGQAISMFQCACLNCQKATGGGHASVVLAPVGSVKTVGATKSFVRAADSGALFTRHFCPECGTTVMAQSSRAPAFRILPVGLFAGQNAWFQPNQLIFARSHAPWDLVDAAMPQHSAYRPEKTP